MEARSNEYSAANCYFICASAVWHQYLCVLQLEKDSENFLLYKGKNNAFVVAASIAGLAIGGASTIGIAENAFTMGLSAGWYDTAWAIGAVVSSMLAVRYLRRSQYTTISGLVRDLYGTKTSFIMVIAMCIIQSGIIALQYKAGGSILASLLPGYFHGSERYVLLFPDLHAGSSDRRYGKCFFDKCTESGTDLCRRYPGGGAGSLEPRRLGGD